MSAGSEPFIASGKPFRTMTPNDFRKLALAIPSAIELSHMNHPDFRIRGRIFASLGMPDDGWGMVKLTPDGQALFIQRAPGVFSACNGAWGRQGCTYVRLESATAGLVREALGLAAENVASRATRKGGPRSRQSRRGT
jgi:hypothetical protein